MTDAPVSAGWRRLSLTAKAASCLKMRDFTFIAKMLQGPDVLFLYGAILAVPEHKLFGGENVLVVEDWASCCSDYELRGS